MGYFDLPRGELELLLKKKGRGRHKEEWKSVMFTDRLYEESTAGCVEDWSKNYKVLGARYNGRKVKIPTNYHWEHWAGDEQLGKYKTRDEVVCKMNERKHMNFGVKDKSKRVPIGRVYFVKD